MRPASPRAPIDDAAFAMPAGAHAPRHTFAGRLELLDELQSSIEKLDAVWWIDPGQRTARRWRCLVLAGQDAPSVATCYHPPVLGARVLLVALVGAACGDGGSGGGDGTGSEGAGSTGADATGASEGVAGCDAGGCSGNVVLAIDGGPTLADVGYERTACMRIESEGQVIELQRQQTCEPGSVVLVAVFRIPARIDATGFYDLGLQEAAASWTVTTGDPALDGTYLASDDVTLSLSALDLAPGGRIAGNLAARVDAIAPLETTGQAAVMFDVAVE